MATYHRGLTRTIAPYRETVKAALVHLDAMQQFEKVIDAIRATPAETAEDLADLGLERLGRYEVHLDRKLERMLTILIRLQNLRGAADPG